MTRQRSHPVREQHGDRTTCRTLPFLPPASFAALYAADILMMPYAGDRQFLWIAWSIIVIFPVLALMIAAAILCLAWRKWRWFCAMAAGPLLAVLVTVPAGHLQQIIRLHTLLPRYMAAIDKTARHDGHRFATVDDWSAGGLAGGPEEYVVFDDKKGEVPGSRPRPPAPMSIPTRRM